MPADREGVHLHAQASGQGRVFQAGRDQHFHYREGTRARTHTEPGEVLDECPYPGLAAFDQAHARWFFGRDRLTADLIDRLDRRLRSGGPQLVVASSGAGKSSLLRAGLLPKLADGALPGSARWTKLLFTPTASPMHALATQLSAIAAEPSPAPSPELLAEAPAAEELAADPQACRALLEGLSAGRDGLLLVVDQFEEVFTLCGDVEQRRTFIDLLGGFAAHRDGGSALLVIGVRADFYAACADFPALKAALQDAPVVVGAMSDEELREAITFPAQDVGLDIEPGLLHVLLRDLGTDGDGRTGYQAGKLPLLAHALRACWQQRSGGTLTVEGYESAGGIQHAISTTADQAYDSLDAAGRRMARSLFLRLIRIGDGTGESRRRLSRADLIDASADPVLAATVVNVFTEVRLLTQHLETVEITHEALLRSWPQLRRWIDDDRAGRLVQQELDESATAWDRESRDPSLLYRGSRLGVATDWAAKASADDLSPVVKAFLESSVTRQRRAARRRTATIVFLTVLALLASTAAVVAADQWNTAVARDRINLARQLAAKAEALLATRLDTAQLLAVAAYELDQNPQTRDAIFQATTVSPHLAKFLYASSRVTALGSSADGRFLVTGAHDGDVRLWDLSTFAGQSLSRLRGPIIDVAVDAGGEAIAYTDGESVQVWRRETGARTVTGPSGLVPDAVGLSPTHRYVVVSYSGDPTSTHRSLIAVHEETTGRTRTARSALNLSKSGEIVFTGENEAIIYNRFNAWERWSVPELTGRPPAAAFVPVDLPAVAAISPKGRFFAAAWGETRVPIWRTDSVPRTSPTRGLTGAASGYNPTAIAVSADGDRLAVADTGRIQVSTTAKNEPTDSKVLTGNNAINPHGLAFLGDSADRLVSASGHILAIWDLNQVTRLGRRMSIPLKWSCMACSGPALAVRPGHDDVLVTSDSGPPQAILAGLGGDTFWSRRLKGAYAYAAWSPDGQRLLLVENEGRTEIRGPAPDWPVITSWETGEDYLLGAAWTPDGRGIITVRDPGDIVLLDAGSGRVIHTLPHSADRRRHLSQNYGTAGTADIDPSTMTVVFKEFSARLDAEVLRVVDMASGRERLIEGDSVVGIAFTQGRLLIQRRTGDLEVRDAHTTRLLRRLPENGHYVGGIWADQNGTVGRLRADGAIVLTDLASETDIAEIGLPPEPPYVKTAIAFLPGGKRLVAVTEPHHERRARLVLWEYSEDKMLQAACAAVGRTLSAEERKLYLGSNALDDDPCPERS
ncbi:nSTAND1 domain-containing NTPase [Nonomuraea gerenzanensis]|uniref:nSTAND1 domain-containing NTPase n=1 Tax=Nonomuraea gerenzanensis TaxID=93944 RepID=UPI001CD92F6A|nr:WD40 repeat domain-containing protein [Nonomuraea gerenzanensis]UBU18317.1 hypothetical protein LCN96_25835 [Nonomuraea gerenzanensis]